MADITLPFVKLPAAFVMAKNISAWARAIYCRLVAYYNRQTGQCNPRIIKLCADLGASASTIKRGLAELRRSGWIVTRRQMRGMTYEFPPVAKSHGVTGEPVHGVTGEPVHGVTGEPVRAAASLLPEPDLLEPDKAVAADVKLEGVRKPVQKAVQKAAAAAAQDCFAFNEPDEPEQNPTLEVMAEAELIVAELMPIHPEPGNEGKAIEEAAKILAAKPDEIAATVETMRQTHAACRAAWANYGPGRFIPQLWRWFRDGDWKYVRPERREVQRESYNKRQRREVEEVKDEMCSMYAELGMWETVREYGGDEAVEVWREKLKRAC